MSLRLPLAAGAALLALLALADYVPPGGKWWADHPMTGAACATVVGFLAVGLLLESWLKERQASQLRRISTIAYRSLAQYANDAGRSLLAPLLGADLYAAGVPNTSPDDAPAARRRLKRLGFGIAFRERTGSWRDTSPEVLEPVLRALITESGFVLEAFRTTATVRRRMQEATALWAPVMLVSRGSTEDLGRLRELTDALELLQEQWRRSGLIGGRVGAWRPEPGWSDDVSAQFWRTIALYERIRDEFGNLADLPSDAIVRRRG
jgi:hypothetical protein